MDQTSPRSPEPVQLLQLNLLVLRFYLGSRVGHAVGHVAYETAHVAVLDELRHALGDIIEEAHGVPQEVHRTQDLGRLADQLLRSESKQSLPGQKRRRSFSNILTNFKILIIFIILNIFSILIHSKVQRNMALR